MSAAAGLLFVCRHRVLLCSYMHIMYGMHVNRATLMSAANQCCLLPNTYQMSGVPVVLLIISTLLA